MKAVLNIVRNRIALLLVLSVALAGCAGPKIAADMLTKVTPNEQPISASGYESTVTINPRINNVTGIDESVHRSLDMALNAAKIFTPDGVSKYQIKADIQVASEADFSFGSFDNKLGIHYTVVNPSGREVFDRTISTVAGSDKFYFLGAKRYRRARAVNIAKNVLEFVKLLRADKELN